MTTQQQQVREILVNHGILPYDDAWGEPIYEVDRVMGWATPRTRVFVQEMQDAGLIELRPIVSSGPVFDGRQQWVIPNSVVA